MNRKTTAQLLGQRVKHASRNKLFDSTLNVLWVGQTNAAKMFTAFSGAGNTAFVGIVDDYFTTVNSINGASASSSIHKDAENSGNGYLWDVAGGVPGAKLTDALTAVDNAGVARAAIDVVVFIHGERDANVINAGTITAAQAKAALLASIDYLRTQLNNPVIILTPLGAERTSSNQTGWGAMRKVQWELWNAYSYISEGPGFWDLTYNDNTTLTQTGYEEFAGRIARRTLALLNKIPAAGTLGPRVSGITFSPSADRAYVSVTHDSGTDFTMTERRGNGVSINAGAPIVPPTSITRIDATSFQINPGSGLTTGNSIKFSWPWGTLLGHTPANCLRDNATNAMPLRPSFDVTATEIA